MSRRLRAAGLLLFVTAVAHSVPGEIFVLRPMERVRGFPRLTPWIVVPLPGTPASEALAKQAVRFGWHLPSIMGCTFGLILFRYGSLTHLGAGERSVTRTIALSLLACAGVVFATTRGKHPGWAAFLATAVLSWTAAE